MSKPLSGEELTEFLEESRGLERRWIDELVLSRKWGIRREIAAWAIAIISVLAVVGLTPLKEPPEMYVVRVDNSTGIAEHVSRLGVQEQDYGERMAKFWLNMYVLSCEGYSWWTIQQQHDMCALLSSTEIQREYGKKFEGSNDLTTKFAQHTNLDIDVHSITLGANQTATVRFTSNERDVASMRPGKPKHLISTIAYQYVNASVTEKIWRINPQGFQVIHYSVDADLSR